MKTPFLTYFFAITLITSIALPTYFSLSEKGCEYSLVITDFEDDSEQSEKNHDSDVKIFHFFQTTFPSNRFESKHKLFICLVSIVRCHLRLIPLPQNKLNNFVQHI